MNEIFYLYFFTLFTLLELGKIMLKVQFCYQNRKYFKRWPRFDPITFNENSNYGRETCIRDRPRFFDQVGHQTTNASIGNKHFFTK